jgi:DNA-binding Lrp family transcriptional regulator
MSVRPCALLVELQRGIPLVPEPFREVAERLGISEEEVIAGLGDLRQAGVLRRFGARIDQRRLGLMVNAMVAWRVPETRIETVGWLMAAHPEVTHCYERETVPGRWDYPLFTVLHQPDRASLDCQLAILAAEAGIADRVVLVSGREFKRVPAARVLPAAAVGTGILR